MGRTIQQSCIERFYYTCSRCNANLFGPQGISAAYNDTTDISQLIDPQTRTVRAGAGASLTRELGQLRFRIFNVGGKPQHVGGSSTTYYTSIGYIEDVGYSINSDFKRYSARLNVSSRPKSGYKPMRAWATTTSDNMRSSDSGSVFG